MATDRDISDLVSAYVANKADSQSGETPQIMRELIDLVIAGKHGEAYRGLRATRELDPDQKKHFTHAVNTAYLLERQLEWTNHGILRSFRFFSESEKIAYLKLTLEMMESLRKVTPHVVLGFGSVLAILREGDFIPHDDDLDILVAFDTKHVGKFDVALRLVEEQLNLDGFGTHGSYLSHRNVNRGRGKAVDVFVGFIESDVVSWYPSRRGNLLVGQVFPPQTMKFFGLDCAVPADCDAYLAATYGSDWRTPISNWNHPWRHQDYEDFKG